MTFYVWGRAFVLALLISMQTIGAAYAHALPGTLLIFSRDGPRLEVTIQFALDDLVIALPDIASLEDAPSPGALPSGELAQLRAYFSEHITLRSTAVDVPVSLSGAQLRPAENDHVGEFTQVVVDLNVALPLSDQMPPLELFYDAIMHEVRSHRATVYWKSSSDDLIALADFRYDGTRKPISLDFQ